MPSSPTIHEKKIPTMPINYQRPSLLNTMKEGLALGVGSSIGHRIVSAAFGEPTLRVSAAFGEPTPRVGMMFSQPTRSEKNQEYEQCMKEYDDKAVCAAKYPS